MGTLYSTYTELVSSAPVTNGATYEFRTVYKIQNVVVPTAGLVAIAYQATLSASLQNTIGTVGIGRYVAYKESGGGETLIIPATMDNIPDGLGRKVISHSILWQAPNWGSSKTVESLGVVYAVSTAATTPWPNISVLASGGTLMVEVR